MSGLQRLLRALRFTLAIWVLTVVVITIPMLGLAALLAPQQAEGSLVRRDGVVVGSSLIGQPFRSSRHLQGRPSGIPHLAPADPALQARVAARADQWRRNGLIAPAADLLVDSASGVDPHLSLEGARQQFPRLALERGLSEVQLERLLQQCLEGPWRLRAIEPVVNVLCFNLALESLAAARNRGGIG